MAKRPDSPGNKCVQVGICLYPGVWEASASLAKDLIYLASVIAQARGTGSINALFLAAQPGEVVTASRTSMRAEEAWGAANVDVLILPSLAAPFLEAARQLPNLTGWISRQHQQGCAILAMTTGSWLLAETGLLDGHAATTHWACVERCRRQYPAVGWTSEQRLVVAGRLLTARDMSASAAALCHIIGRVVSVPIAERTYQYALIHEPGSEGLPLLHTVPLREHGDALVLQVQEWLEARYGAPISATEAARLVHMSQRNLRRRFLAATGLTFSTYLTKVRLARARALLLSTDDPVAQIAHRVGYADASTFTALFKQHHRQTPSAYRTSATDPLR